MFLAPPKVLRAIKLVEFQAPARHLRWRGDDACKPVEFVCSAFIVIASDQRERGNLLARIQLR
jgi:hypothetical protein